MNDPEILVIDDEPQIRKMLEITLDSNGYKTILASNGKEGIIMAANHPPELILLDLGLPDINGHEVLKKIREWYNKPIVILSVQSAEEDIVKALDNGANDYLVKPFRTGELLARIRSCVRMHHGNTMEDNMIESDGLQIDLSARSVKLNQEIIKLTTIEYNLLSLLAQNSGKVLTHQFLLKEIWGPGYIHETQYLRVFIAQVRKKIEKDPNRPERIITESGIGYRFI